MRRREQKDKNENLRTTRTAAIIGSSSANLGRP